MLSMISIAGLTLTTLPPFARLGQSRTPQLEQRIEKEVFDESSLSRAIGAELEKAAQLLNQTTDTEEALVTEAEEIIEAEWEELAPPTTFQHYPLAPIDLPSQPRQSSPLPEYPIALQPLEETEPQPLPYYPTATLDWEQLLAPSLPDYPQLDALTRPIPHYPQIQQLSYAVPTELPHYPQLLALTLTPEEESAFEEKEAPTLIEEAEEETTEWLPTRERADALFIVCQHYQQIEGTEIPLSILIGGADEDELLQLSSESLDGALLLKEQLEETLAIFGFDDPQTLLDHLFYCSISRDREIRLQQLLSAISPLVIESMTIPDEQEREQYYQQIFDHLFEAGEFLTTDREALFEKWHQEFIPPVPVSHSDEEIDTQPHETPEEAFASPSQSAQERISAALENLQQQQELELPTPEQQEQATVEMEREALSRKRKISRLDTLSKQQGLPLEDLIEPKASDQQERDHLLNLLLAARSDPAEEYRHFHGHLKGTPADLLIESLLKIQLQNRICNLYLQLRHLEEYETIEAQLYAQLEQEFGAQVVKTHRTAIEQQLEWASSSGRPHCNNHLLPQAVEL